MATLSVLKFDDPNGADRVLMALQGLQERQMITLEDAAVVSWPLGSKKPKTRQLHGTAGAGATWGAFWGFLFGLIFFMPFLGAAIGAGTGALSGSLADVGIDDDFIKQVRDKVTPGHLGAVRPHQRGDGCRQGCRRAEGLRLRDHLHQPARGAGAEIARGLRPRVVENEIAAGRSIR